MLRLRPDIRRYQEDEERSANCRRCGTRLIVLPGDKRRGFCFDCYETLMSTGQPTA